MGNEYRAKVFKSGNSLAIRLPKALGVVEGAEFDLIKGEDGRILVRPAIPDDIGFADVFGMFSRDFLADGRQASEEPERDWAVTADRPEAA